MNAKEALEKSLWKGLDYRIMEEINDAVGGGCEACFVDKEVCDTEQIKTLKKLGYKVLDDGITDNYVICWGDIDGFMGLPI